MLVNLTEAKSVNEFGGKAINLCKLLSNGFNVPSGFVVSTNTNATMTDKLEKSLLRRFDQLGATYVAVRSSAVVEDGNNDSWAGQLETYLNVSRDSLVQAVLDCWASAQSDRAITYSVQTGAKLKPKNVAVVIQSMIDSEVSGVAFSSNPVTSADEVVIEAGYGLGEAVVSGTITPDNYVVSKASGGTEKYISTQAKKLIRADGSNKWVAVAESMQSSQKLNDELISKVSEETIRIEKLYGKPMDIEWAIIEDTLYITQARPITTLR